MEKQGMDHGIGSSWSGLLKFLSIAVFLTLTILPFPLRAQNEARENLIVQIVSTPANPVVGGFFTVTILVDHPLTHEVNVRPPSFPLSLILERVRTEIRIIGQINGTEGSQAEPGRWTAVEFLFSLREAGTAVLDPFEVTAGNKHAATVPITVQIRNDQASTGRAPPSLRWERAPASIVLGKAVELDLVLAGWDPSKNFPRDLLKGRIPEKVILEELPSLGPGPDGLIRYPVRIIPLEGENFILGPLQIQIEGEILEIPQLYLYVSADPAGSMDPAEADNSSIFFPDMPAAAVQTSSTFLSIPFPWEKAFPQGKEKVFFLFRNTYEKQVAETARLWEEGRRPEALSFIRKNERDSLSGPFLISLSREMERELSLTFTSNEAWGIWNHPVFPWAISLLLLFCGLVIFKKQVTSGGLRGFKSILVLFFLGGWGIISLLTGFGSFFYEFPAFQSRSAVLEGTGAFRVPDTEGVIQAWFDEGQPVKILSSSSLWVYAESIDGRAGWVPIEKTYPY